MKESIPTRETLLQEMSSLIETELQSNNGTTTAELMRRKVLLEKKAIITQMQDELPHFVWPEPAMRFSSSYRRYYSVILATVNGWSCGRTHTDHPHAYITSIQMEVANSTKEYGGYGSAICLQLEIDHELGIEWFINGKYDIERHERYDLSLPTVMKLTVDNSMCQIVALEWVDTWKQTYWRDVVIPSEILKAYQELVKWRTTSWEQPSLAERRIAQNTLLFSRKVRFLDNKVMEIRLESGEDDVWLCGRMLDRTGKELTFDYFRWFPGAFAMQVGDICYEAILREARPQPPLPSKECCD